MPSRSVLARRAPRVELLAVLPSLAVLATAQHGVLTRRQLLGCGVPRTRIDAEIAARRRRAVGRQVVVLSNAPLTAEQRNWTAVLLLEEISALAGLTSAAVAGLSGFEDDVVHLLVAHGSHAAFPSWIKIHESRRFAQLDVESLRGLPRTGTARSLVDAAVWTPNPRRACAILCAGAQQRLTTPARLAEQLSTVGRVRHRRILRDVVGDISGGGHTLGEIELAGLARQAGFSHPRRQVLRRERDGRVRYLDVELDLPDGSVLAVEIDGAVHLQPRK